jgi:hypothetical protein
MLVESVCGPGAGCASGGVLGQIGTCSVPGEGGSAAADACEWADVNMSAKIMRIGLYTVSTSQCKPYRAPNSTPGNRAPTFWRIDDQF